MDDICLPSLAVGLEGNFDVFLASKFGLRVLARGRGDNRSGLCSWIVGHPLWAGVMGASAATIISG